ncbi:MAG: replication initiation protein [Clostridia bacterium]|nr:replication initiation protein [Clostridia bacterium]
MPSRKRNKADLEEMEQALIRQSNELIQEGTFELRELREQRILLFLLSRIKPWDTEFEPVTLNRSEFARISGVSTFGGKYLSEIDEAIARLYDANLTFRGSRWIPKADGSGKKFMKWITAPEQNNRGQYILQINPDMAPYLLELRRNYTTLELAWLLRFRGTYTIRAYAYLKSRHFDKAHPYTFEIELDELREVLGATCYPKWRDFERRVLRPAFTEITARSDTDAAYTPKYTKNKVTGLEITVSMKDNMKRFAMLAEIETDFGEDQLSMWLNGEAAPAGDPQP